MTFFFPFQYVFFAQAECWRIMRRRDRVAIWEYETTDKEGKYIILKDITGYGEKTVRDVMRLKENVGCWKYTRKRFSPSAWGTVLGNSSTSPIMEIMGPWIIRALTRRRQKKPQTKKPKTNQTKNVRGRSTDRSQMTRL